MANWTWFGVRQGPVSTPWPPSPDSPELKGLRGLPEVGTMPCLEGCKACLQSCPTEAISLSESHRVAIDYGRCVLCNLCVETCPAGVLIESREPLHPVDSRKALESGADQGLGARRAPRSFRKSIHVRHIDAGSCNGCESETAALFNPFYNLHRLGIFFTASPRFADVLLVTGPVTAPMSEPLLAAYEAIPAPKWVVVAGVCAISGGTNGGGLRVGNGVEGVLPVDIFIPGCPPPPTAILEGLLAVTGRAPSRASGQSS